MRPRRSMVIRPTSDVKSAINVTPLVDVVLVLLIIFMVVMPLLEKQIALRVPETDQVEEPSEVPDQQILVRVERDGSFTVNGQPTPADGYVQTLRQLLDGRSESGRVVFVASENEASYAKLVRALEGAREAGAATLAMAPDPSAPPATP